MLFFLLDGRALDAGGRCPYCAARVGEATFSVDHATPVSRRGGWGLDNLVVCCAGCNSAKGCLTDAEYHALLGVLDGLGEPARTDVLRRLKAGARRYQRRR